MANTLTNLTDTMIANAALEAFTATLLAFAAFSTNVSPDPGARGDKVKVLWTDASAAATAFVAANGYEMQAADAEGLDVTLDQHYYVSWGLQDVELSNNPQLNIERFGRQKGFQLAKKVLQDVLGLVTAANFPAVAFTGAAALFDADEVANIEQGCDEADWSEMDRSLILKPAYRTALVKDNAVQGTLGVGGSPVLTKSQITEIHNFALHKSNLIPANGENLVGMAVHPDAILIAMRYLAPQQGHKYFQAAPITNDSGLVIGFRDWYDENAGTRKKVLEAVWGKRKGNGAAIQRVRSAA